MVQVAVSNSVDKVVWTSSDLELLPDDGKRYEIIDGELFVTRAPIGSISPLVLDLGVALKTWSQATRLGYVGMGTGLIFGEQDDVIPDLVWISNDKYEALIDEAGHLQGAPELVIEVLSAGAENERRDRQVKLKLYSARGVLEYWIADWRSRQIEVYRRENGILKLTMTLYDYDTLTSLLLPEFSCSLAEIFA